MAKIFIPKMFVGTAGNRLIVPDQVLKNQTKLNIFNNSQNLYELTIPNKRRNLVLSSAFLEKLNVKNDLSILAPNIELLAVLLGDQIYNYSEGEYQYHKTNVKKLNIESKFVLDVISPAETKYNKGKLNSLLEDLTLTAAKHNCRLNSLSNIEKITFKYNEFSKTLNKIEPHDWSNSTWSTISIVNCPKLKEIDLSDLKDYGSFLQLKLSKIPDDCIIKINPEVFNYLKFLSDTSVTKSTIRFTARKQQNENSQYLYLYQEAYDFSQKASELAKKDKIISITFNDLKAELKTFLSQPKQIQATKRNDKRADDAKKRRQEAWAQFCR